MSLLPRLIARLDLDHPRREDLISRFHRMDVGYVGEKYSDRFLERALFRGPVHIFANVELEVTPFNFIQIDTLVISPSFIFLLEVKNISGELRFIDSNPPSLHRTQKNGEINIMDCPVYQLEKNMADFDVWLEMNGFPVKSSGTLVLAFKTSIVKIPTTTMPTFYAKELPLYLRKKESDSPIMSLEQFEKIADLLIKANKPFNPIPLSKHLNLDPTTIRGGVICVVCHGKLFRKNLKTWFCYNCEESHSNPYEDNIKDWFLLIKDNFSINECREFLELKNRFAAQYAIQALPLEMRGKSVSIKYYFPSIQETLLE